MGFRNWLNQGFLRPFAEREQAWADAVNGMRDANPTTSELLQAVLEGQLERSRDAVKNVDDKAALVIPGVGAIVSVVGTNVSPSALEHPFPVLVLEIVFVAAALSVLLALVCLAPVWERSDGPLPMGLVMGTGDDPLLARVRVINALGFAVESTEQVANAKAFWLAASLRIGGVAVLALLVFVSLGGLSK